MARKIRITSAILIILIIIGAITGIAIVRQQTVRPVSNLKMKDNTTTSILVSWNKLGNADGYYLYSYDRKSDKSEKIATIKGRDTCTYKLNELTSATKYELRVFGYKTFLGKEYVSTEADTVSVFTLPDKLDLSAFSGSKGVLSAEWMTGKSLAGYEIEYSKDKDFKGAKVVKIDSPETRNFSVDGLKPDDVYFVRGRACMDTGKEKIYGDWSEAQSVIIYDKPLDIGNINPDKPMVAFTFDDGPAFDYKGDNSTERILDVLEKYGASATFFMVGDRVDNETKHLLEREIELGCELGNHTLTHKHYGSDVTPADITKANSKIKKYCGQEPTIFRCPGGAVTKNIRNECKKKGMPLAFWSIDTEDWKSKNADKIYKRTINQVYDGCIVLMHDIYPSTADAVEKLVPALIKKGYQVVSVSKLIEAKTGDYPKPGQQYVDYETINNNT